MANRWQLVRAKWIEANPPDKDGYYICAICKQKVHISKLTFDHIISKYQYPELKYDLTNLQPAHKFCNNEKGDGVHQLSLVRRYGRARKRIW